MFVKIIYKNKKKSKDSINPEHIYDCVRASIFKKDELEGTVRQENSKGNIILNLDIGNKEERTIDIELINVEIIFMNNDGKTIDRKVY